MAWIVKNSAASQIQRRDQPYLDEALKTEIQSHVLPKYPTKQAAVLPVLHAIQHKHNWIPHQAIQETAEFLELPAAEVLDTASFYEDFWLHPKGKYLIMICQSISCELMNHNALLEKIKSKLDIDVGQTTQDNRFTLMTAECLGSCDTAPCALVNEKLFESLTPDNVDRVLDDLA